MLILHVTELTIVDYFTYFQGCRIQIWACSVLILALGVFYFTVHLHGFHSEKVQEESVHKPDLEMKKVNTESVLKPNLEVKEVCRGRKSKSESRKERKKGRVREPSVEIDWAKIRHIW